MRSEQEIIDAWKVGIAKEREDISKFGYSEDGGINYPDDYEHKEETP